MVRAVDGVGQPPAYRQFILKVHSRCDLSCDYCYVYTLADQRWRDRPRVMPRDTVDAVARRIAEHASIHRLPAVEIVLHGGEPLLAGPDLLAYAVRAVRAEVAASGADTRVSVTVQTNAVRLDAGFLALFGALGVRVGVSLDGDRAAHDRHRVDPRGRSSYGRTIAGLRLLRQRPELFAGLLCTVDLRNDPVGTYQALLEFGAPAVDFLLPHANWSAPPPGRAGRTAATPYADWLTAVFDRWYGAASRETSIRLFESVIARLLGGRSRVEGIGPDPVPSVVVDTGGAIERSDLLAASAVSAAVTGLHIATDPFDRLLAMPAFPPGPAPACRRCAVFAVCGGGLAAHRFDVRTGFANRSVYCADLYALIEHIRVRLSADVAALR
jgi:uncharacterized protein